MPEIILDLSENYQMDESDGVLVVTRPIFVKNCVGSTPMKRLYSAYDAPGMPQYGSPCDIHGIFCRQRKLKAWGDTDAEVSVVYREADPFGGGTIGDQGTIEVGADLSQVESNFAGTELLKPFAQRVPLTVNYAPPNTPTFTINAQSVTLPVFVPRPTECYRKKLNYSPGKLAKAFVGCVNSNAWKGHKKEEALCTGIRGVSADGGQTFDTTFAFATDWFDQWYQYARWRDPILGTFPKLTAKDIKDENGIIRRQPQPRASFASIPI